MLEVTGGSSEASFPSVFLTRPVSGFSFHFIFLRYRPQDIMVFLMCVCVSACVQSPGVPLGFKVNGVLVRLMPGGQYGSVHSSSQEASHLKIKVKTFGPF